MIFFLLIELKIDPLLFQSHICNRFILTHLIWLYVCVIIYTHTHSFTLFFWPTCPSIYNDDDDDDRMWWWDGQQYNHKISINHYRYKYMKKKQVDKWICQPNELNPFRKHSLTLSSISINFIIIHIQMTTHTMFPFLYLFPFIINQSMTKHNTIIDLTIW